jgi:hypothetical protein
MRTPSILEGVRANDKFGHGEGDLADDARHWSVPVTVPHYVNEDNSEMRGIKPGWYATDSNGNLSSGPFPRREECLSRCTQLKNRST